MKTVINRWLVILLAMGLLVTASGCGSTDKPADQSLPEKKDNDTLEDNTSKTDDSPEMESSEGTLVVYFSATGTTAGVAEKIAAITGGDLYRIVPAEPYSSADLNWNDRNSRSTKEQNDSKARPQIAGQLPDLTGYGVIYIGFPVWWGEEPRIMDTFAESCDFTGKTVIPFCTSSSSGIGRSGTNMEELAGSGNWLNGRRFAGSVSEADLKSWIDSVSQ